MTFIKSIINTPLGPMIAISDDKYLYLLEFIDKQNLEKEFEGLRLKNKATITSGSTGPIRSINVELELYFSGHL